MRRLAPVLLPLVLLPLVLMAGAAWGQQAPPSIVLRPSPRPSAIPEPSAKRAWEVKVFQIDKSGTLVGNPIEFPCGATGCERPVKLDVAGEDYNFLIVITFVPRGAYFALQPLQPEITKVIEFEKTFLGPTFLQLRNKERFNTMLRYTLVGPALKESADEPGRMMNNDRSRVFQRKLTPDVSLRLSLAPATDLPATAKAAPPVAGETFKAVE